MILEILAFLFTSIVLAIVSLIIYARWNFGSLEALGIPVEEPHWLLGNSGNLHETYPHLEDIRKVKKLGLIYGHYEGRTPLVYVADPKALYKMFFSEMDYLEKKKGQLGNPVADEMLEFLDGEKWKTVRNILSPVLTTGKLKTLAATTLNISETYVDHLKSKMDSNGRVSNIDLHELTAHFAIEVIGSAMCGIQIENPKDKDNNFVKQMRTALFDNFQTDWIISYIFAFKFLMSLFPIINPSTMKTLKGYVTDVLNERQKSGVKQNDTVNALLEMRNKIPSSEYKKLGIKEDTVIGQAYEFFLASYLGVVTISKKLMYLLITHLEIYEKVMEEINQTLKKHDGQISYDSVVEMEYLTACIYETLRICPGFTRLERTVIKDWTSDDGIRLPKGTEVAFPLYAIHHNPDIYPEPEKYKPERFLPENKKSIPPGCFLSFGAGPRQCLGPRVALQFIKIYIVSILKEFKLEGRSDTVWKKCKGGPVNVVDEPIYMDFVKI